MEILIKLAQPNHRMFNRALHTPGPDPSDSDVVLLALETARALEVRGDLSEAVRWLRRAATEAEKQANDARVLVFAHAAADLTNSIGQAPSAAAPPVVRRSEPFDSWDPTIRETSPFEAIGPAALEPATLRPASSLNTIPDSESSIPTIPPPASPPEVRRPAPTSGISPPESFINQLADSPDQPVTERRVRLGAIRVAVKKPTGNAKSFSVERLDTGQRLPAGTMEAMLVLMGETDSSSEPQTDQDLRKGSMPKR